VTASIVRRVGPSVGTPLPARVTGTRSRLLVPRAPTPARVGTPPPVPSDFSTWTPGTVQPVGLSDPGATNVGPRIGLTTYVGDVVISAGQTVSGLDIYGKVTFTGAGTLRDCIVRGTTGATNFDAAINATYNGRGSVIEWVLVDMTGRESVWTDGIRGNNFTMRYCEIIRTTDGFGGVAGAYYGPTVIENTRIHDGYYTAWLNPATGTYYPGFPSTPSDRRAHNDGVQIQGFGGYTIRGNYIGGRRYDVTAASHQLYRDYLNPAHQPYIAAMDAADDMANSAIIIQNNVGSAAAVGALVELNWLAGGDAAVNLNGVNAYSDTLSGVTVQNNRFISNASFGNVVGTYQIYRSTNCTATITGNVWDEDDTPVPINTY
jgi:hypothetical protein